MPPAQQPSFSTIWNGLPLVTRYFTLAATISFAFTMMFPYKAIQLWYFDRIPWTRPWTIITSAISMRVQNPPLNNVMILIYCWINLRSIEEGLRLGRGDLLFYLVFAQIICIIVGPTLGMRAFLPIHAAAFSYTIGQYNPHAKVRLFGLIEISQGLVPWSNILTGFLLGGGLESAFEPLLGIFIGHLHLFLTELLPKAGGPALKTPRIFKQFDVPTAVGASGAQPTVGATTGRASGDDSGTKTYFHSRFSGKGHRLGE